MTNRYENNTSERMIYLDRQEWWPVYVPDPGHDPEPGLFDLGKGAPVSDELIERFNANYREFSAIQAELKKILEATS